MKELTFVKKLPKRIFTKDMYVISKQYSTNHSETCSKGKLKSTNERRTIRANEPSTHTTHVERSEHRTTRRSSSGRPKQATRRSSSGPTIEPSTIVEWSDHRTIDDRRVVGPSRPLDDRWVVRPSNHSTIVEWSTQAGRSTIVEWSDHRTTRRSSSGLSRNADPTRNCWDETNSCTLV